MTTARQLAIDEGLTWQGTPFVYDQCVKGKRGGVDCGRFLASALIAGGKRIVISDLPHLPPGWFFHRGEDCASSEGRVARGQSPFLDIIREYAVEYRLQTFAESRGQGIGLAVQSDALRAKAKPEPADIVIAKCGRDWAHCALVIAWPRVIAAACEHVVTVWENIYRSPQYMNRELRFFDPWIEEATRP